MAEIKKISELNRSTESIETDLIPVVQGGINKATPVSQILDKIRGIINSLVKIEDSLTSTSTTKVLSANQGYVLDQKKVDKINGKGLSSNDLTNELLDKLNGISSGAQVNPRLKTINNISLEITSPGDEDIVISGNTEIVDNIVTWDNTKALSAKQGVVLSKAATDSQIGRVKPDNVTTFVNEEGVLRTVAVEMPSYKVMIFKKSTTQPITPNISVNPSLTNPNPEQWTVSPGDNFYGWVNTISGSGLDKWWMSVGTVNGTNNRVSIWSVPVTIVGEEGQSGGYKDFKFGIGTLNNYPTPFNTSPNNANSPNNNPTVWKDFIDGNTLTPTQYLWMTNAWYQDGLYDRWAIPVKIDGKDGTDGKDGEDIEFIFIRTVEEIRPLTPISQQEDDFVPSNWTDDPIGSTALFPFEWTSKRTKTNGIWSTFSTPGIFSKYSNDGDWITYVFKKSNTQPTTPTGTNPAPTGWVDAPDGTGEWWMSKGLISGKTGLVEEGWSIPVKVTGSKGDWVTYVFKQSTTQPATPTGTAILPSGWSDAPTSVGVWWMSKALVLGYEGTVSGTWSSPIKVTGEDGEEGPYTDFKYNTGGSPTVAPAIANTNRNPPGWSDTPPTISSGIYLWMSQATINASNQLVGTWSAPVRISGENGFNGDWTSFVFRQSETQPATPTGTAVIPSGWVDSPSGTGTWWMSKSEISGATGLAGTWSTPTKITGNKGDTGPQGVPGTPGEDGVVYYTWIRYADTSAGGGISNNPTGKTYIGFAYNKTTATESNTPSDYTWSLIKGTDGQPGAPGSNTYTWIKYSNVADGTGMYDIPTDNTKYIGIAVNKTTPTESTNKADYTWSKFRGEDGVNANYLDLTNENVSVPATSTGTVVGAMPTTTAIVYKGASIDTGWAFTGTFTGCTGSVNSTSGIVTITAISADSATVSINATKAGNTTLNTIFTISKVRAGANGSDGADAVVYSVQPSVSAVKRSATGVNTPTTITCDKYKQIGSSAPAITTEKVLKYQLSTGSITNYSGAVTIGTAIWIDFILYDTNETTILDKERVPVVIDGTDGEYTLYQFAKNTSMVTAPTTGWVNNPPSLASGEYLWMRSGIVIPPATLPSTWTTAVRISGENGSDGKDGTYVLYQWAKNTSLVTAPSTGWAATPPTLASGEYLWMRFGTVTPPATSPATWSTPVRISGEVGQPGKNGPISYYMGSWSSTQSYKGTDTIRNIVSVTSGSTTTYYITIPTAGTFTGNAVSDTTKWATFEANYKSIATDYIFSAGANIAGWVFRINNPGTPNEEQFLESQNGSSILNGTTGEVTISGSFKSNNAGSRFEISNITRDISMYDANNNKLGQWWYDSSGATRSQIDLYLYGKAGLANKKIADTRYSAAALDFSTYEWTNGDTTVHNSYGALYSGNLLALTRYDGTVSNSPRFRVFTNYDDQKLRVECVNLPTTAPSEPYMLWNDEGILKITS